jgi:chemotaxis protein CheD
MTASENAKPQNQIIVGISEYVISNKNEDVLITFSLGSCIGVSFFDPITTYGALIHCMLPSVSLASKNENLGPSAYVDSGIQTVLQNMIDLGSKKKNLVCKVAGCSTMFEIAEDHFKIGEKNYAVSKMILNKNAIEISGELIGGRDSKTMWLEISTGKTVVQVGTEILVL